MANSMDEMEIVIHLMMAQEQYYILRLLLAECSVCGLPVYSHVIESTWNRDCLVEQRACRVDCCRLCAYDVYALCVTLPWWQSNFGDDDA